MNFLTLRCAVYAVAAATLSATAASAQQTAPALKITRANLAQNASFSVTQTSAPKGGTPFSRTYQIEVKGSEARVDLDDPNIGPVRYVANKNGLFLYTPGNKIAMKQSLAGGVEEALQVAFTQVQEQLKGAVKKPQKAIVSGQPTDMYESAKNGVVVYWGTRPGFRLPVKAVQKNIGGSNTLLVTNIKLDTRPDEARFVLPKDTKYVDSEGKPMTLPAGR